MYKIGDIMESDGMKRRVTGFTVINGERYPETAPVDFADPVTVDAGETELRAKVETELRAELEISIRAELEEKIRAEAMAELDVTGTSVTSETGTNTTGETELKCRYCGKAYKDHSWLAAHEEKCPENPANKKDGE